MVLVAGIFGSSTEAGACFGCEAEAAAASPEAARSPPAFSLRFLSPPNAPRPAAPRAPHAPGDVHPEIASEARAPRKHRSRTDPPFILRAALLLPQG